MPDAGAARARGRTLTVRDAHPADPMGDLDTLLAEVAEIAPSRRRLHCSYFVRFADRGAAERSAKAASRDGWVVASFSDHDGHVVRLSRLGVVTAERLSRDRAYLTAFATGEGGRWHGLVVENLAAEDYWSRVARKYATAGTLLPAPRTPTE